MHFRLTEKDGLWKKIRNHVGTTVEHPVSPATRAIRSRISDEGVEKTVSVCPYCAVGCSTLVYHRDGRIIDIEGNPDSPINAGTLCPKGSATFGLHVSPYRWTKVRYRRPYSAEWEDLTLEEALDMIAERVKKTRDENWEEKDERGKKINRSTAVASIGGATIDNEENYLITKLFHSLGFVRITNQARILHSSTVPGLGITYGRGGATTTLQDLQNSDCVLIEGSNMAEAHPVGFRHPMIAKNKGATLIHVDPRFTRTSALCDIYAPIRPGTDIAFLGGLINYVIQNERYFKDYVVNYTNAATLVTEEFQDADASGFFSGWDGETRQYDPSSWRYEGTPIDYAPVGGSQGRLIGEGTGGGGVAETGGAPPTHPPPRR